MRKKAGRAGGGSNLSTVLRQLAALYGGLTPSRRARRVCWPIECKAVFGSAGVELPSQMLESAAPGSNRAQPRAPFRHCFASSSGMQLLRPLCFLPLASVQA